MDRINLKIRFRSAAFLLLAMAILFSTVSPAFARIVEDVEVRSRTTGYQIHFKFFLPLRYQSHSPRKAGRYPSNPITTHIQPGFR